MEYNIIVENDVYNHSTFKDEQINQMKYNIIVENDIYNPFMFKD